MQCESHLFVKGDSLLGLVIYHHCRIMWNSVTGSIAKCLHNGGALPLGLQPLTVRSELLQHACYHCISTSEAMMYLESEHLMLPSRGSFVTSNKERLDNDTHLYKTAKYLLSKHPALSAGVLVSITAFCPISMGFSPLNSASVVDRMTEPDQQ